MISDTKKETEKVRVEFIALQEEKIKRGDIDDAIQKLKEAQNEVKKMEEIDKKEQDRFKRLHENRQNYKQMSTEEQQDLRKEKEKETL